MWRRPGRRGGLQPGRGSRQTLVPVARDRRIISKPPGRLVADLEGHSVARIAREMRDEPVASRNGDDVRPLREQRMTARDRPIHDPRQLRRSLLETLVPVQDDRRPLLPAPAVQKRLRKSPDDDRLAHLPLPGAMVPPEDVTVVELV